MIQSQIQKYGAITSCYKEEENIEYEWMLIIRIFKFSLLRYSVNIMYTWILNGCVYYTPSAHCKYSFVPFFDPLIN